MSAMQQVVGAAIVRHARVLAARRTTPPEAAGRWELPGGKVEVGETPMAAIEREIAEELGCDIEVTDWLKSQSVIEDSYVLIVALARLTRGEPEATEHDELRWLSRDELHDVDWLEPDRPFLAELAHHLGEPAPLLRAILFDEDDARAVAQRLARDGFETSVVREPFQGEDDDEDHPWAVLTDAPELVLEVLVDDFDGWLDLDEPAAPATGAQPVELPTQPKRLHRDGS